MRIGWRAYLKQKLRAKSHPCMVGVAIDQDAVTFCALSKGTDSKLSLIQESVVSKKNWAQQFRLWVEQNALAGASVNVAFSIAWYQQLQIDRPAVADEELDSALKWSANELIASDEPHAFDYFDLPVPLAGNKKLNIIAIKESAIKDVVEACYLSGLNLINITVEELVTCNLPVFDDEPVLTLIQDASEEVCLNIVKNGVLYFSRRLKGFENLSSFSADELRMGIADSLCVQIQRSMDYFESQLRQPPIRNVRIKMDTVHISTLVEQIASMVSANIDVLHTGITIPPHFNECRLSYTAIGAALDNYASRQEAVS